ncbi:unnamed protein product [Ceratitis capitata]|uniref:(Mediterranean fruit fly) hypothetical protein n=1 Tax=Ceratitis capitata TaxID=7213 RepID=A0A811V282_CERCA|nr:unnamed protein product [Ceratitis capitata]
MRTPEVREKVTTKYPLTLNSKRMSSDMKSIGFVSNQNKQTGKQNAIPRRAHYSLATMRKKHRTFLHKKAKKCTAQLRRWRNCGSNRDKSLFVPIRVVARVYQGGFRRNPVVIVPLVYQNVKFLWITPLCKQTSAILLLHLMFKTFQTLSGSMGTTGLRQLVVTDDSSTVGPD